ncbi:MAG: hypothetical protein AUG09_03450 [Acidobacteria bacterium 13_1_20CM_2_68_7]|nr:MAG: hypothetical protein AUG09_03450 [Acidobacteria bacterium 13_1_20CM_2_68_7]
MSGADGIDARILAFVLERFPFARQRRVAREDSLLESGIVDSLGVLELVEFLERTFGVSVTEEDLLPENFDSIRRMAEMVDRKVAGRQPAGDV